MKIVKYRYFNFILHTLAWSIVLLAPYLISDASNQYKIGPLPGLYFTLSGVIHMIIFYGNSLLLFPKFLNRTYWWLYIITAILLIAISAKVKFYILATWFPDVLPDARVHVVFPSILAFIVSVFYSIADRIGPKISYYNRFNVRSILNRVSVVLMTNSCLSG